MTPTPPAESLTTRTARAARWRLTGALVGAVFQFVVGVLLARLLTPADFGVAALAYVVFGLAQPLGDLGLGSAIVQRARLTDRHIRTAFTCSVLVGMAIAAVMVAAAPLGAAAMRDTKVTPVLRLLSAGIVLRGTSVVADALLRRDLDFKRQFLIETTSYVLGYGAVAVGLALRGYGVWSLVWGGLVQTMISSVAEVAVVRHPVRPLLATSELQELLGFGFGAAVSGCVSYVALNADYFVVGRSMGAVNLGLYTRAYGLMKLPHTYAASVLSRVMFPAFAQVQDEPARLQRGYLLLTELTAMIAAPAMGTMAIVAPHFVRSLYGPQWSGVVIPLQILCLGGYCRALYHLGNVLAQSVGRVYGELWLEVVYAGLVIAGALIGSHFGLAGVAVGVTAAILYMFVASGNLALSATRTPWRLYLRVQRGAFATAAVACGAALAIRLLLEAAQSSSGTITFAVFTGAAVPSLMGLLWTLGRPDFEPFHAWLPRGVVRLSATLGGRV